MKPADPKTSRNFRTRSRRARLRKSTEPMQAPLEAASNDDGFGEGEHTEDSNGAADACKERDD